MTDPIKPAPAIPDKTPQAQPAAGSLQGPNPPATVTPSATGEKPAPLATGASPDPHEPGKFLEKAAPQKVFVGNKEDVTVDTVTGIRTDNKTGKRTSRVVSKLSGTVSAVARQYIGTGPLNVHTPGGEVKAYSGDFILTFDEPQWEIVDAELVKVMDRITKQQKLRQTNLVISKEQMAVLGWTVGFEEIEVAADKPL